MTKYEIEVESFSMGIEADNPKEAYDKFISELRLKHLIMKTKIVGLN